MNERFILASKSPRRRELLAALGLSPTVMGSAADEATLPGEQPITYALRVALAKAEAVQRQAPKASVLAADTVVALDGRSLGKAKDQAHARAMLAELSGRDHVVHTAVALLSGGQRLLDVVSTEVRFRRLGDEEIARYVASGEPMDKAGAYGIQGLGGALVAQVRGSYTNVVGLPLEETMRLLRMAGLL